jgi:hypothetical protein
VETVALNAMRSVMITIPDAAMDVISTAKWSDSGFVRNTLANRLASLALYLWVHLHFEIMLKLAGL